MSPAFRMFLETEMATECDVCGARFDLMKGGACQQCRRILCGAHLHGSWFRRLAADFGGRVLCVQCRSGAGPKPERGSRS
jgi:hypothetical protein